MSKIKILIVILIITTFSSCKSKDKEFIKGVWGVYDINYKGIDLINENRKTKSIVDLNLHIELKYKKILLVMPDNNINGDFNLYTSENKISIKVENSNDIRYNNSYDVFVDTIPLNPQNNIVRLSFKSEKMHIKARKVIPNTGFKHDKNRKDGLKMYNN